MHLVVFHVVSSSLLASLPAFLIDRGDSEPAAYQVHVFIHSQEAQGHAYLHVVKLHMSVHNAKFACTRKTPSFTLQYPGGGEACYPDGSKSEGASLRREMGLMGKGTEYLTYMGNDELMDDLLSNFDRFFLGIQYVSDRRYLSISSLC